MPSVWTLYKGPVPGEVPLAYWAQDFMIPAQQAEYNAALADGWITALPPGDEDARLIWAT